MARLNFDNLHQALAPLESLAKPKPAAFDQPAFDDYLRRVESDNAAGQTQARSNPPLADRESTDEASSPEAVGESPPERNELTRGEQPHEGTRDEESGQETVSDDVATEGSRPAEEIGANEESSQNSDSDDSDGTHHDAGNPDAGQHDPQPIDKSPTVATAPVEAAHQDAASTSSDVGTEAQAAETNSSPAQPASPAGDPAKADSEQIAAPVQTRADVVARVASGPEASVGIETVPGDVAQDGAAVKSAEAPDVPRPAPANANDKTLESHLASQVENVPADTSGEANPISAGQNASDSQRKDNSHTRDRRADVSASGDDAHGSRDAASKAKRSPAEDAAAAARARATAAETSPQALNLAGESNSALSSATVTSDQPDIGTDASLLTKADNSAPIEHATAATPTTRAAVPAAGDSVAAPAAESNLPAVPDSGQRSSTSTSDGSIKPSSADTADNNPEVERARFVQRVARAFEAARRRDGEIRLRLHPPELGSLRMEMQLRGDTLTAHLEVETQAARNALIENLAGLRDRLAEMDIRIERFEVELSNSGGDTSQSETWLDDGERHAQQRWNGQAGGTSQQATEEIDPPEAKRPGHDGNLDLVI